jgi:hypothetical protein
MKGDSFTIGTQELHAISFPPYTRLMMHMWASNYCFLAFGCISKRFSVEEASTNLSFELSMSQQLSIWKDNRQQCAHCNFPSCLSYTPASQFGGKIGPLFTILLLLPSFPSNWHLMKQMLLFKRLLSFQHSLALFAVLPYSLSTYLLS